METDANQKLVHGEVKGGHAPLFKTAHIRQLHELLVFKFHIELVVMYRIRLSGHKFFLSRPGD
ncbi:MAG: hypothetical protein ACUVXF_10180, partial [Desulfobaccales bacterium]